jgi:hypothetical protein
VKAGELPDEMIQRSPQIVDHVSSDGAARPGAPL